MTKEEAQQKIAELVKKYESYTPAQIKKFNEEQTKQGFILPLFNALGWNTEDTAGEVVPEDKVSNERVDYAFKIKEVPKLYVEAKALKADLTNPEYVKQAITYAYNKGLTWAVLTDFEGVRLFNAQTSKAFITLDYKDYLKSFDRLWLLSKESITSGLLNEEAVKYGALPQSVPIEKRLYSLLRQWREKLFNEIHGFNEKMKLSHIDEVIQRLFNRLIFIRTCEDRGIEERQLLAAAHQWETGGHRKEKLTEAVKAIFAHFNDTYDSELFEPHLLDSDKVFITEQTLRDMLTSLYDIPGGLASYDFSVIKPDVLGAVYEQYLGYVATKVKERAERQMKLGLTEDEAFVVTAKKEHRKEQGIYYTPAFVTDYIVRETVGRFIEEHSYNEIRNIKILDPACGSGSFLIRAYEELLEYHAKERSLPLSELQTSDRLTVLLNNIFGVDLDMQAVEIARLNLLLRTVTKKQRLPFIRDTIRQGNSLISGTPEELKGYFGDNWKAKKPFNWNEEFPEIMKNGGFDVVIGNPPYVTEQIDDAERAYYKLKYSESTVGKLNTYRLMMDKGIQLLKEGGLLGFIIPATCLTNRDSTALRELILDKCKIMNMLTIPEKAHIFDAVTQATAILVLQKTSDALERQKNFVSYFAGIMEPTQYVDAIPSHIEQATFQVMPDKMFVLPENKAVLKLIKRLDDASVKLSTLAEVYQGEVNLTNYKDAISDSKLDSDFAPLLRGINIDRYVLYPQDHKWVRKSEIRRQHAESDRIVTQEVSNMQQLRRLKATIAPKGYFCGHTTNYILLKTPDINLLFILGLLNSKVLDFYFKLFNSTNHLPAREIERLPIRKLDLSKPDEKKSCDAIRVLTDRMLDLNKKLAPIKDIFSNEREELVKEIEKTDKEIDNLVYDLYGLTEEERKIVEGGSSRGSIESPRSATG